jgi:hypothetical protein
MPEDVLKRVTGPDIVSIEKHVEAMRRQQVVKLQGSCPRLNTTIADKNPPLSP